MSNTEADREITGVAGPDGPLAPTLEVLEPREVLIGPRQAVRRVLPNKERRMIGAWCFVDHYGPTDISGQVGMRVPPHPHSGLQTVSWLFNGEIQHRDSLGSDAVVMPGQLNLMTSGPGISHSEESAPGHSPIMHGVQLWVALPESARHTAPRAFTQYRELPSVIRDGLRARVIVGAFEGVESPATSYSPMVGVELVVSGDATVSVDPAFEYGVLAIDDALSVEGTRLSTSEIAYVGGDRGTIALHGSPEARCLLLGGEPFEEELVMWWNFIGRSHDEIVAFRRSWNDGPGDPDPSLDQRPGAADGGQFGVVNGFSGDRLPAPPMPGTRLKSRPRAR